MPPTECIYQVSHWYLKACWRKVRKTRTDGRTDRPNCDVTQTRHVVPPTECIYQVSHWYLKACWRKVRKTRTDGRTDGRTDRRTDGRTLPRHNTSRFSNGRIKKRSLNTCFKISIPFIHRFSANRTRSNYVITVMSHERHAVPNHWRLWLFVQHHDPLKCSHPDRKDPWIDVDYTD